MHWLSSVYAPKQQKTAAQSCPANEIALRRITERTRHYKIAGTCLCALVGAQEITETAEVPSTIRSEVSGFLVTLRARGGIFLSLGSVLPIFLGSKLCVRIEESLGTRALVDVLSVDRFG